MSQRIDITTASFVRLILLLLGLVFLYLIRDVLVLLFLVLIIVAGLSPIVNRWSKNLSRPGAVITVFLLIFILVSLIVSLVVPPLVNQIQEFSRNLPTLTDTISRSAHNGGFFEQASGLVVDNLNSLSRDLANLGGTIFSRTLGVISGVVAVVTMLVLVFYLLLEEEGWKKMYKGLLAPDFYNPIAETTRKIGEKLGAWLHGQVFLMVIVGALTTLGLALAGIPYALALGIWAGLTEIVPIVGPWVGAIPGIIVGFAISPFYGLLALIIYLVVQQIENHFLVPKVMSKAVGLNPVIVIIAILIGGKLYGVTGILLSVPLAAVISVVTQDWNIIRQTFKEYGRR